MHLGSKLYLAFVNKNAHSFLLIECSINGFCTNGHFLQGSLADGFMHSLHFS